MNLRMFACLIITAAAVSACDSPVADTPLAPQVTLAPVAGLTQSSGGGGYTVTLGGVDMPGGFSFAANDLPNGRVTGQLRYTLELFGEHVEFHGSVTCLTVDAANGRAWIGGVITKNKSVREPYASGEIFQPGKDIWFRVLDDGEGSGTEDRTTFVGFEGGGGIITSQEYCDAAIWPDDNARTWPVTAGNIQVK